MVSFVARVPVWPCIVDAGRRGAKVDSGSATDAFGPWRSCAARHGQTGAGVAEEAIYTCSPHSVLSVPAQRPSRPPPGCVHGAQPIDS